MQVYVIISNTIKLSVSYFRVIPQYMEGFKDQEQVCLHIPHKYSKEIASKSEVVSGKLHVSKGGTSPVLKQ